MSGNEAMDFLVIGLPEKCCQLLLLHYCTIYTASNDRCCCIYYECAFDDILNGDSSLLQRMLSNLICNSIVHNPDGYKISVLLEAEACFFSAVSHGLECKNRASTLK